MNGMLAHCRFTSAHLYMYTRLERGAVGVKCIAQEQNRVSPARREECLHHKATTPPTEWLRFMLKDIPITDQEPISPNKI